MNKMLLLHIGTPKTGTTSLQSFLYNNEKLLRDNNWSYPDLEKRFPDIVAFQSDNHKNGTYFLESDGSNCWSDVESSNWKRVWEVLYQELDNYNVILSAEEFWLTINILEDVKKMYDNVKVIVYLRRQDEWLESIWNHRVQHLRYTDDVMSCLDSVIIERMNYYDKLQAISNVLGKDNVIVRVYEQGQFEGKTKDIISDFMHCLQIKPDWEKINQVEKMNRRLKGNWVEIKRVLNTMAVNINDRDFETIKIHIRELSDWTEQGCKKESYLSLEDRRKCVERFAEQNRNVARFYLKRENGILFYENGLERECNVANATNLELEILQLMFQQMIKTEAENRIMKGRFNLLENRDKELVLFGAGQKCVELLEKPYIKASIVLDNSKDKCGKIIKEINIQHPTEIEDWTNKYVVITCMQTDEIEKQLKGYGLNKDINYIFAKDFFY